MISDTLKHRLLLAKPKRKEYFRQPAALKLMQSYLAASYQKIKVNNVYSSWSETKKDSRQNQS